MLKASFEKKIFEFKRPGGTSRGVLTEKHAWFIYLSDSLYPDIKGTGECSIIPGLSPDFENSDVYERKISNICQQINEGDFNLTSIKPIIDSLCTYPSIVFGLETALLDLENGGRAHFFDTSFTRGESRIPVNGLIWMGNEAFMQQQIEEKLQEGYNCIKMKIGAIDFDKEFAILQALRNRYATDKLILRVDANGAFSPQEAPDKLNRLASLSIHSIEQPIKAGQWDEMAELCSNTSVPIALDEELIGISDPEVKQQLLDKIRPQYIILKPSLHGGFSGCTEWIKLADEPQIPWWMTSALESNVGLNAIAQFTSTFDNPLPQGLGTGSLYVKNTPSKLICKGGFLQMSTGS